MLLDPDREDALAVARLGVKRRISVMGVEPTLYRPTILGHVRVTAASHTAQPVRTPPTTCSTSAPVRSPRPRTARAPSSPSTTPAERNREMAPHTLVTRTWCRSVPATGGRLGVDLARGPDHAVHRRVQIPADSCAVELPAPEMAAWGAVALAQTLRFAVRSLRHRRVAAGS